MHRCNPVRWLLLASALVSAGACSSGESFDLVGTVERRNLELTAPVSELIVDIPVQVGQRVPAGQLIVQLDTEVAAAELKAVEAEHAAAQAAFDEAQKEFVRNEGLRRGGVTSVRELDRARRGRDEAAAQLAGALARVKQAERHLRDLTILSRDSGVVDQIPFEVGERVPAGGVVAVVLSDDRPWVRVWLPARAAGRARPGLEAEVRIGRERPIKGRVEDVSREPEFTPHYALTERERAHLVYETRIVLLDAPSDLRPGLPADVRLTIPDEAPASREKGGS